MEFQVREFVMEEWLAVSLADKPLLQNSLQEKLPDGVENNGITKNL